MEYREFGRSKVKVSAVGMGTYYGFLSIANSKIFGYQRNRQDKVSALKKGLELEVNLIDTAEIYDTEPLVAEAIREFKRDDLFIATKVLQFHLRYDQVLKAAKRSLC
ncbi:MAG: aldo/keto reductase, partial [Nitrososphaeria archaeon]